MVGRPTSGLLRDAPGRLVRTRARPPSAGAMMRYARQSLSPILLFDRRSSRTICSAIAHIILHILGLRPEEMERPAQHGRQTATIRTFQTVYAWTKFRAARCAARKAFCSQERLFTSRRHGCVDIGTEVWRRRSIDGEARGTSKRQRKGKGSRLLLRTWPGDVLDMAFDGGFRKHITFTRINQMNKAMTRRTST